MAPAGGTASVLTAWGLCCRPSAAQRARPLPCAVASIAVRVTKLNAIAQLTNLQAVRRIVNSGSLRSERRQSELGY